MKKKELIDGYEQLLLRYHWAWFGTLTFRRRDIKFWRANEAFWQWIVEIENAEGLKGQSKTGHGWSLQNRPYGMARDVILFIPLFPDQASLFWFSSSAVRTSRCGR